MSRFLSSVKRCKWKCARLLPVSMFGKMEKNLNQGARDGLNTYCKDCIRGKIYAGRVARRERKQSLIAKGLMPEPKRKPMAMSRAPRHPVARVRWALGQAKGFDELCKITKLSKDRISDILAGLYDANELQINRVGESRVYSMRGQQ